MRCCADQSRLGLMAPETTSGQPWNSWVALKKIRRPMVIRCPAPARSGRQNRAFFEPGFDGSACSCKDEGSSPFTRSTLLLSKSAGKRGQFLIMSTTPPTSSGGTGDGSDHRACPSPSARRSTSPSSSSPPTSAPPCHLQWIPLGPSFEISFLLPPSLQLLRMNSSARASAVSARSSAPATPPETSPRPDTNQEPGQGTILEL